jgi:hypothetical protein
MPLITMLLFPFPTGMFLMGDVVRNSRENSWDRPCLAYTHPRRFLFAASSLESLPNHSLGVEAAHRLWVMVELCKSVRY